MKLAATFKLPLPMAPTMNTIQRMHWAKYRKLKQQCATAVLVQIGKRTKPLKGRPLVLAKRFSTKKTDQDAGWSKLWLDCLKAKGGLGWIVDDSPDHVDVAMTCEPGKRGAGYVLVEIWAEEEGEVAA